MVNPIPALYSIISSLSGLISEGYISTQSYGGYGSQYQSGYASSPASSLGYGQDYTGNGYSYDPNPRYGSHLRSGYDSQSGYGSQHQYEYDSHPAYDSQYQSGYAPPNTGYASKYQSRYAPPNTGYDSQYQSGYAPQAKYGSQAYYPSRSYSGGNTQAHGSGGSFNRNTTLGTWSDLDVDDYTTTYNEKRTKFDKTTDKAAETKKIYNNANRYENANSYTPKQYGGEYISEKTTSKTAPVSHIIYPKQYGGEYTSEETTSGTAPTSYVSSGYLATSSLNDY